MNENKFNKKKKGGREKTDQRCQKMKAGKMLAATYVLGILAQHEKRTKNTHGTRENEAISLVSPPAPIPVRRRRPEQHRPLRDPSQKNLIVPNPFARWNKSRRSAWEAQYEKKRHTNTKKKNGGRRLWGIKKKKREKLEKWFLSTYKRRNAHDILRLAFLFPRSPRRPSPFSTSVSGSVSFRFARMAYFFFYRIKWLRGKEKKKKENKVLQIFRHLFADLLLRFSSDNNRTGGGFIACASPSPFFLFIRHDEDKI